MADQKTTIELTLDEQQTQNHRLDELVVALAFIALLILLLTTFGGLSHTA